MFEDAPLPTGSSGTTHGSSASAPRGQAAPGTTAQSHPAPGSFHTPAAPHPGMSPSKIHAHLTRSSLHPGGSYTSRPVEVRPSNYGASARAAVAAASGAAAARLSSRAYMPVSGAVATAASPPSSLAMAQCIATSPATAMSGAMHNALVALQTKVRSLEGESTRLEGEKSQLRLSMASSGEEARHEIEELRRARAGVEVDAAAAREAAERAERRVAALELAIGGESARADSLLAEKESLASRLAQAEAEACRMAEEARGAEGAAREQLALEGVQHEAAMQALKLDLESERGGREVTQAALAAAEEGGRAAEARIFELQRGLEAERARAERAEAAAREAAERADRAGVSGDARVADAEARVKLEAERAADDLRREREAAVAQRGQLAHAEGAQADLRGEVAALEARLAASESQARERGEEVSRLRVSEAALRAECDGLRRGEMEARERAASAEAGRAEVEAAARRAAAEAAEAREEARASRAAMDTTIQTSEAAIAAQASRLDVDLAHSVEKLEAAQRGAFEAKAAAMFSHHERAVGDASRRAERLAERCAGMESEVVRVRALLEAQAQAVVAERALVEDAHRALRVAVEAREEAEAAKEQAEATVATILAMNKRLMQKVTEVTPTTAAGPVAPQAYPPGAYPPAAYPPPPPLQHAVPLSPPAHYGGHGSGAYQAGSPQASPGYGFEPEGSELEFEGGEEMVERLKQELGDSEHLLRKLSRQLERQPRSRRVSSQPRSRRVSSRATSRATSRSASPSPWGGGKPKRSKKQQDSATKRLVRGVCTHNRHHHCEACDAAAAAEAAAAARGRAARGRLARRSASAANTPRSRTPELFRRPPRGSAGAGRSVSPDKKWIDAPGLATSGRSPTPPPKVRWSGQRRKVLQERRGLRGGGAGGDGSGSPGNFGFQFPMSPGSPGDLPGAPPPPGLAASHEAARAMLTIESEFEALHDEYQGLCQVVEQGGFTDAEGQDIHVALQEVIVRLERKGAQLAALQESLGF